MARSCPTSFHAPGPSEAVPHTRTVVPAAFIMLATCSARKNGLIGFARPAVAPAQVAMNDSARSGVKIDMTGRLFPETSCSRFAVARIVAANSA